MKNRIFIAMICQFALLVSMPARAQQTTGDILGTVTDTSGGAVPEAQVTVTNTATRIERTATTAANGDYVVNLLQPGTYRVTISATGFKSFKVSSVQLGAGDRTRVDAGLAIGDVTQSVTVEAEASALQTDSSSLSSTISQVAVQNVPLNGRNFVQLVQVQPGVNQGPPNGLDNGTRPADLRQTATFSANGQDDVLNNEMIDGADNNERLTGTIAVRSSLDAIDQVRVDTNNYTADVGRTGGAVGDVITKSGTNDFHGDVFEFIRNDFTDANSYSFGATTKKSKLRWNQFGGSLGGPIVKNKAFFFGDYEGYRLREGLSPVINTVPTLYEEQNPGDFSDVGGPVVPSGKIDPVALYYFQMYPAPNHGTNQYFGVPSESQNSDDFDSRGDVHLGDKDSAFARFIYNRVTTIEPGSLPLATVDGIKVNPYSGIVGTGSELDYDAALNYTHIFGPNLLMNLFASYTRAENSTFPHDIGLNPNSVDPLLGDVSFSQSHGISNYNALQTSVDRRFSKGLGFQVNYTYAQSLSNNTPASEQGQGGYGILPSKVNTQDYGNRPLEVRHAISGTINYALPFGQSAKGLEGDVVKGWQVNVLGLWATSVPFTVINPANVSNTTLGTNDRVDVVGKPHLSNTSRLAFFDPGAFASQAKGTLGNERIFQYFGPTFRHLDMGLSKTFAIGDRLNVDFTAQSFNLFNTPNFANPNATLPAVTKADTPAVTLSNITNASVNTNHFGQITVCLPLTRQGYSSSH